MVVYHVRAEMSSSEVVAMLDPPLVGDIDEAVAVGAKVALSEVSPYGMGSPSANANWS